MKIMTISKERFERVKSVYNELHSEIQGSHLMRLFFELGIEVKDDPVMTSGPEVIEEPKTEERMMKISREDLKLLRDDISKSFFDSYLHEGDLVKALERRGIEVLEEPKTEEQAKKITIDCNHCDGTGESASGQTCAVCCGAGTYEVEPEPSRVISRKAFEETIIDLESARDAGLSSRAFITENAKRWGVGVEPEPEPEQVLPDITQGNYTPEKMHSNNDWKVVSDKVAGTLAYGMTEADAKFYAAAPDLAKLGLALINALDAKADGDPNPGVGGAMFELRKCLRNKAGVDI